MDAKSNRGAAQSYTSLCIMRREPGAVHLGGSVEADDRWQVSRDAPAGPNRALYPSLLPPSDMGDGLIRRISPPPFPPHIDAEAAEMSATPCDWEGRHISTRGAFRIGASPREHRQQAGNPRQFNWLSPLRRNVIGRLN